MSSPTLAAPAAPLLRIAAVADYVALSRSSVYKLVKAGQFPKPISIYGRTSAWITAEVDQWVDAQIAAARGGAAK